MIYNILFISYLGGYLNIMLYILYLLGLYVLSVYNYVEISTTCLCFSWLITEGRRRGRRSAAPKIVRVRESDLHARPFGPYGSKI
jgi:hypothetical protein